MMMDGAADMQQIDPQGFFLVEFIGFDFYCL